MTSLSEQQKREHYMRMAISLAMRGTGSVSPNPRVGCVIVDERGEKERVVGLGWHKRYGGPHAEAEALKKAGEAARGCTAYVNLEPCCHTGKTPPCTDALIRAGVARVVAGMRDPNPRVAGGGMEALEAAGIEVVHGVLEEECRWLNRGFIRRMTLARPWVTIKAALSLDGCMALESGESKWISGALSRQHAHMLRAENDAVMVGAGTVAEDDPMLTVRDVEGRSPMKVVLDRELRTPPGAKILHEGSCVFFTGPNPDPRKAEELTSLGAKVVSLPEEPDNRLPLPAILGELANFGVNRLMVEAGPRLVSSLIDAELVDEFSLFVAPKLLGRGLQMTRELSFAHMQDAISMKQVKIRQLGDDIWYEGVPSCSPAL